METLKSKPILKDLKAIAKERDIKVITKCVKPNLLRSYVI